MAANTQRVGFSALRYDRRSTVVAVRLLMLVGAAAFSFTVVPGVRAARGFSSVLDGWLQGGCYVAAALLCALRPTLVRAERWLWSLVAGAVALRAFGFVLYVGVVRTLSPQPYPSIADASWLGMYVLLLAALVGFGRCWYTRVTTNLVLDACVGALAIAGVALALLYSTLLARVHPGPSRAALVANLVYPALDCLLLLVILGALVAAQWRPPRAVWVLGIGVSSFAIGDGVFLAQVSAHTFRPGTPISALSLWATCLIAYAGWLPRDQRQRARQDALGSLLLPGLLALLCVVLLVYATARPVPVASVIFASGGVLAALARTGLTFRSVHDVGQLRLEARTDELTGLANRRAFTEALSMALRKRSPQRSLAVLIIDIDNFKDVNDALGHHYGDELLSLAGPRLQTALRSDDLLARIGGDEFAVILEDAGADRAAAVAERLRAGLLRPFVVGFRDVTVGASIGVAGFPEHGLAASEVLRHADLAMYDAKAAGIGYALYNPDKHHEGRVRSEHGQRLREAIDGGELVLHYQPQVSLSSGRVVGVEALVRWEHPQRGLLAPATFLPQVESGGLMRQMTLTVLEQAIRQAARWHAAELSMTVAVNLSVTSLLDLELPTQVGILLDTYGLPGRLLVLELTEDLFMADPPHVRRVVAALLRQDVTIHVDDYGCGYSSLGYLRDLKEIGGLKLDKSFVTHLDSDPRARAIVSSTVALAGSLRLELIAEGVETSAVRDCLVDLGCHLAQGYLFSRPVPAANLGFGIIDAALVGRG